ncbi:hypothetical protein N9345_00450 [Candidatus Thioglobus sp.]|nr:hypothetical protein [Candidatus Thioglobus sp.]
MSETEFLIGRRGLDLIDDFYPDDLPSEWRFDFYSTLFKALSLPIDTEEDLELIFEEIEDSDEEFELVLTIEPHQLLDINTLSALLSVVEPYQSWFILSCELEQHPSAKVMALLDNYRVSFQSDVQYDLSLNNKQAMGQYLYYSHLPVFSMQGSGDDKKMRANIEKIAEINTRTILICKSAESEALHKIRVIAEILGY